MQRFKKILYSQKIAPYLFICPFVIVFLLFFVYPVISAFIMSFQYVLPGETHFVGLDNYKNLNNPVLFTAIKNSLTYTFFTILLLIPGPLILACLLNSKKMRLQNLFRSTFFIPALTSVVVAGTIFRLIFGELEGSLLNNFLGNFGVEPIRWLKQANTSMFAMVLLACWRWTGVNLLYFMSGLKNIPNDLYESSSLDGATATDQFFYITIPLLRPVMIYVLTISIYGGLSMFTESYMLFSGNGSPNDIGTTIVGYLYRQGWEQYKIGYGCAIGISLLFVTFLVTVAQLKMFGFFRKED